MKLACKQCTHSRFLVGKRAGVLTTLNFEYTPSMLFSISVSFPRTSETR